MSITHEWLGVTKRTYRALFVNEQREQSTASNSLEPGTFLAELAGGHLLLDDLRALRLLYLTERVLAHAKLAEVAGAPYEELRSWTGVLDRSGKSVEVRLLLAAIIFSG